MRAALRTSILLVGLVLAGLLVSGCGGDDSAASGRILEIGPPSSADEPTDQTDPGLTACDEVVAGIDAFNAGDFDETVRSFERALPLAEAEDAAAGTQRSADLLEAVEYYAALPAEDYLAASATSPDFARYKAITLGQCRSGAPVPDDGGVLA